MSGSLQVWPGAIATKSPSFDFKRVGLLVKSNRTPTFDEWEKLGKWLQNVESGLQWWVGDWLNHGETAFGEKYAQAIESTGWQAETLRQYQYCCSRVPFENRREDLTFSHHREIADIEEDKQAFWLEKAAEENWTVARLRAELNAAKNGKDETWVLILAKDAADAEKIKEQFVAEGRKVKVRDPRAKKEKKVEEAVI